MACATRQRHTASYPEHAASYPRLAARARQPQRGCARRTRSDGSSCPAVAV